ncbi:hypothetical protein HRbin22_01584 [Candidatus Thermoflexus japonica]|uniref:Uncharacterized protein n=1 Tax=Candidatus Thermoflexus japonica TaxID=2035417 RepID=A0A2H5Y7C1_9CHLR|nr:hypothetical protein HRbin22_01584 [Candidatus Thermoflexus japonica]
MPPPPQAILGVRHIGAALKAVPRHRTPRARAGGRMPLPRKRFWECDFGRAAPRCRSQSGAKAPHSESWRMDAPPPQAILGVRHLGAALKAVPRHRTPRAGGWMPPPPQAILGVRHLGAALKAVPRHRTPRAGGWMPPPPQAILGVRHLGAALKAVPRHRTPRAGGWMPPPPQAILGVRHIGAALRAVPRHRTPRARAGGWMPLPRRRFWECGTSAPLSGRCQGTARQERELADGCPSPAGDFGSAAHRRRSQGGAKAPHAKSESWRMDAPPPQAILGVRHLGAALKAVPRHRTQELQADGCPLPRRRFWECGTSVPLSERCQGTARQEREI